MSIDNSSLFVVELLHFFVIYNHSAIVTVYNWKGRLLCRFQLEVDSYSCFLDRTADSAIARSAYTTSNAIRPAHFVLLSASLYTKHVTFNCCWNSEDAVTMSLCLTGMIM